MELLNLPAPAKLNLFLHITGRLPNGYHELQSVFVLIDLCDRIDLRMTQDGQIHRTGDVIGDVEKDLCVRAARLLKEKTGCPLGVAIHVEKKIPSGAGMGGGSSDAATTLMGLNRLWNLGLSKAELMEMAPKLGADVPFFLLGTNAWVEGIGEKLTPIDIPETLFEVIWPGVHQGTPEIFSHKDLTRDTERVTMTFFADALAKNKWSRWGHNDLEPIVRRVNPEVAKVFELLPDFRMTGSGSAVFKPTDEPLAKGVLENFPQKWQHFLVKSFTIHPLLSA
ncbi:MAG: 4-(cytidine 5'-diphospho)-2-C-methyl-D-erythritol kinase [Burkholderiaceae bacterium]|nr:4-(cytidine 5'-diphospho)-2-C-methyl-D-erythritol kinase [Burkholderiaceae bacterium]